MTPDQTIGDFNPNDTSEVAMIKGTAKRFVQIVQDLENTDGRRKAIAITHIEEAAMMAVKSVFTEETK